MQSPRPDQLDQQPSPMGLVAYGWNESIQAAYISAAGADSLPARIVRADGATVEAAAPMGTVTCHVPASLRSQDQGPPTTGDWVAIRAATAETWVVDLVLPRSSLIARMTAIGDDRQVLAANVDVVFLVVGLERDMKARRLERTLVMAWDSGAIPVVVLTKTDLATEDSDLDLDAVIASVEAVAPGVPVLAVSNTTGDGVDLVKNHIQPGSTVALIGESGVGKSSLVNQLLDEERQFTLPTRESDGKGVHTTTSRELIALPGGGMLIDTPGLRGLGLWEGSEGMSLAFPEIDELAAGCRFRDCTHQTEPGCAVLEAVEDEELDESRLHSYRKLQKEIAFEARRTDQRLRRAEERATGRHYKKVLEAKDKW